MKKLLAIVISMAMVVAMMPVGVFAADTTATVTTAEQLKQALEKGGNVQLGADIDISNSTDKVSVPAGKTVILDLNGNTLTAANTVVGNICVYGEFTLEDSKDNGKILSKTEYDGSVNTTKTVINVDGNGKFTMESGEIYTSIDENAKDKGNSAIGVWANAKAVINGGKVTAGWYTVASNGSNEEINKGTTEIIVNGGELISTADYAIYAAQKQGYVQINGGTIYGYAGGIAMNGGSLEVNNGVITSKGTGDTGNWGDGTGNLENAAININAKYSNVTANIKGGDFIAEGDAVVIEKNAANESEVTITGGTFSGDVSAYVADGVLCSDNGNKTWTVGQAVVSIGERQYASLQAAFNSASKGDTVTLLDNITVTKQIDITNALDDITLNGNNHTITAATTEDPSKSGGSLLYFGNDIAKLYCTGVKIKDINIDGRARFAIFLCGGTSTTFDNVKISGDFLYAINLYGTHGGTFTNCDIRNSLDLGDNNGNGSAIWTNVAAANPIKLVNSHVSGICINKYTDANTKEAKIYLDVNSTIGKICSLEDGLDGDELTLCLDKEYAGKVNHFYYYKDNQWNELILDKNKVIYVPTTDNVTNNTTDKKTTADLTPAVSDNKSTTTVDNATADKIVDKAVENKSTEVIVDAKGNNTVASSEVAIPEKTVKEISEKTDANLVIKTDNGTVDLDRTALAAVAEQAGTTGTVTLVVETVKTDENICHVELKLVTSNGAVKDFKGGNVKVTIDLNKELAAKELVCVYIDDNDIYTLVEGVLNADGTYTFTTGHFSEYAVMAKADADKVIADQLNTLIKEVNLKVRTSKTSKKNIKAVVSGDVKALTDAGYTVKYKFYRSTKKASKYTAAKVKDTNTYINTTGKKGTKYYYKAKALVYDGDKLVGQTVLTQCRYGVRTWSK